jgi:hypothetical protein|nr:hypothetical protein [uncultured Halomonas sp.]
MIEIIELITAITVLLASLAGFSAVNKWKKETFEKKKTKIIDAYEENLISMRLIIRKIVNEDFDYNENQNGINSANEFINYKKIDELERLRVKVAKAQLLRDRYMGSGGDGLTFSCNYYSSVCDMLFRCIFRLTDGKTPLPPELILEGTEHDSVENGKSRFNMANLIFIMNPYTFERMNSDDKFFRNARDNRKEVELEVFKSFLLEKKAAYSSEVFSFICKVNRRCVESKLKDMVVCSDDVDEIVLDKNGTIKERKTSFLNN